MRTPLPEEDHGELGDAAGLGAAHRCQGCAVPQRSYTLLTAPAREIAENQPSEGSVARSEGQT